MRALVLALCLSPALFAAQPHQSANAPGAAASQPAVERNLLGQWIGVLEYRDYSEPAESLKRVQLPTWLTITAASAGGLTLDYLYDDGPNKVVSSTDRVTLDLAQGTYTVKGSDPAPELYKLSGELKDGRGVLVLTGTGTDSKKPADIRTTLTIRRNLLTWLEEVRPAGSAQAFAFRHRYTFTRAEHPAPPSPAIQK